MKNPRDDILSICRWADKFSLHITVVYIFIVNFFIAWLNRLPEDVLISSDDRYDYILSNGKFSELSYLWIDLFGAGGPNQFMPAYWFYFLKNLFINGFGITSGDFHHFVRLSLIDLSWASFAYAGYHFFALSVRSSCIAGIIYAFNIYTLGIVTSSWGYGHYWWIFPVAPVLIGGLVSGVLRQETTTLRSWITICLVNFIVTTNVAFLVFESLLVVFCCGVQILYLLYCWLLDPSKISKVKCLQIKKIIYFVLIYGISIAPSVVGQLIATAGMTHLARDSVVFGGSERTLENFVASISSDLISQIVLIRDVGQRSLFDRTAEWLNPDFVIFAALLTSVPVFATALLGLTHFDRRMAFFLIVVYVFCVIFSSKLSFFVAPLNKWLLVHSGWIFRSPDKPSWLLPFLTCLGVARFWDRAPSYLARLSLGGSVILILLFTYVFGSSKITDELSGSRLTRKGVSTLLSVPNSYKSLGSFVNAENPVFDNATILTLPKTIASSVNWAYYPKWNFEGVDIVRTASSRLFVNPISVDNPSTEKSTLLMNSFLYQTSWYIHYLISEFGARFILWHNDADEATISANSALLESLVFLNSIGDLHLLEKNEEYTLWSVDDSFVAPMMVQVSMDRLSNSEISGLRPLVYHLSPVHWRFVTDAFLPGDKLSLKRGFNRGWVAVNRCGSLNQDVFTVESAYDLAAFTDASGKIMYDFFEKWIYNAGMDKWEHFEDNYWLNSWKYSGEACNSATVDLWFVPHLVFVWLFVVSGGSQFMIWCFAPAIFRSSVDGGVSGGVASTHRRGLIRGLGKFELAWFVAVCLAGVLCLVDKGTSHLYEALLIIIFNLLLCSVFMPLGNTES